MYCHSMYLKFKCVCLPRTSDVSPCKCNIKHTAPPPSPRNVCIKISMLQYKSSCIDQAMIDAHVITKMLVTSAVKTSSRQLNMDRHVNNTINNNSHQLNMDKRKHYSPQLNMDKRVKTVNNSSYQLNEE